MQIYPYSSPIILNTGTFTGYGGKLGTFNTNQLLSSFLLAEMAVTKYIGTFLLPTIVTGTFAYAGVKRVITDYGYVSQILDVEVVSVNGLSTSCDLQKNSGCAFIYDDTFGYIDVRQVLSACQAGISAWYPVAFPSFPTFYFPLQNYQNPYQFQVAYQAGLPTGTSTMPGILEALTIMAQIDLNEKDPGNAGMNEGVGDVGISKFSDLGFRGYTEERKPADMRKTILGSSPKANYAARLIDMTVRKARPLLRM